MKNLVKKVVDNTPKDDIWGCLLPPLPPHTCVAPAYTHVQMELHKQEHTHLHTQNQFINFTKAFMGQKRELHD